ncbi:hypothetical protein [Bacillus sp. YC2]|uniref:hypothetical protein n=1 Tax=Bacillus sp. YC2 TaxID=2861287 RepID=UPI00223AEF31|nr:hypothetical protein [Bacillus sp. YC2]
MIDRFRAVPYVYLPGIVRQSQHSGLFAQKRFGWNPGAVNFLFDLAVVLSGIYSVSLLCGLSSIVSIAATGAVIGFFKQKIADGCAMKPELVHSQEV